MGRIGDNQESHCSLYPPCWEGEGSERRVRRGKGARLRLPGKGRHSRRGRVLHCRSDPNDEEAIVVDGSCRDRHPGPAVLGNALPGDVLCRQHRLTPKNLPIEGNLN